MEVSRAVSPRAPDWSPRRLLTALSFLPAGGHSFPGASGGPGFRPARPAAAPVAAGRFRPGGRPLAASGTASRLLLGQMAFRIIFGA